MRNEDGRATRLREQLADARSRRVVFVSHCLLDQNVRYLGGAESPGVVPSAIEPYVREGVGLRQMPCPEEIAWGGVMKRLILRAYGARWAYRLRALVLPLFLLYTRLRYWKIARRVAAEIADCVRAGIEVVGVVGVGDSPSCGVDHTLDLRRSLPVVASMDVETIDAATFKEHAVRSLLEPGEGLFIAALRRQLRHRGLSIAFTEHVPGWRSA
jgi:uncharacterized protein YbbK (DUF523 family)